MKKNIICFLLCFIILCPLALIGASAANYTMTTQYAITTAAVTYFKATLGNASMFDKYIIFQNSQYNTICFIGQFRLSGNTVTCESGEMITYNSNVSTNDRRYISSSSGAGHTITITNGVIYYTNIKGIVSNPFPASVMEFKDAINIQLLMYIVIAIVLFIAIVITFNFIKKRWLDLW